MCVCARALSDKWCLEITLKVKWPWWNHIKSWDVRNIVKWYGIIDKIAFWYGKIEKDGFSGCGRSYEHCPWTCDSSVANQCAQMFARYFLNSILFWIGKWKVLFKEDKYNTTGAVKKKRCLNSYGVELSSGLKQSLRRIWCFGRLQFWNLIEFYGLFTLLDLTLSWAFDLELGGSIPNPLFGSLIPSQVFWLSLHKAKQIWFWCQILCLVD